MLSAKAEGLLFCWLSRNYATPSSEAFGEHSFNRCIEILEIFKRILADDSYMALFVLAKLKMSFRNVRKERLCVVFKLKTTKDNLRNEILKAVLH